MIFNVGSFNFIAENMLRCAVVTFKVELLCVGLIMRITGVVIILLTMVAAEESLMNFWLLSLVLFLGILAIRMSFLSDFAFFSVGLMEVVLHDLMLFFVVALLVGMFEGRKDEEGIFHLFARY